MADLVLGIAKPLVLGTLNRAQLAIEEESKFRASTQRDLVFITGEFRMMQSFLSDTTEESVKSNVVSTWVTQVRDLAYDVEDGVEFIVHLDTRSDCLFRYIPRYMRRLLPLDHAVDMLEQLKERVLHVSQRNERYKLINDPGSNSGGETNQLAAKECDTARKHWDMEALTMLLTKEKSSELQVISVWAPDGDLAAAASIMMKAYHNLKTWGTSEGRFDRIDWVKLDTPNMLGFIKRLMYKERSEEIHVEQDELLHKFNCYVNNGACLFVLEDVPESTTEEEWHTFLKYLPKNNGSRIYVSTKHPRIARLCTGSPCFQRFSTDQSLCVFFKEGQLIGRMLEVDQLSELMESANSKKMQVMSVWGIAGAGKSALVRKVYLEKLQNMEYGRYIWVDVPHPFSLQHFYRSLLLQLGHDSLEVNEDKLARKCQGLLNDRSTCLLVIDNLRSTRDWEKINDALSFRLPGNLIIVITHEERIALHCADRKNFIFNVKALEGLDDLQLFRRQVGKHFKWGPDQDELISNCGGLPEVIVSMGYNLDYVTGYKHRPNPVNDHSERPETVNDQLNRPETVSDQLDRPETLNDQFINDLETDQKFGCLRDLFGKIHSNLRSCPDVLKPCIFYLSIFPRSHVIRRRCLVMRWVAEGFSKDGASDSAEESGEELFAKICERSIIKPDTAVVTNIRAVRCKMNTFFQEYIKSRPNEDNVAFALEVCALKGSCRQTTGRTGRHIVVEEGWHRDKIVFECIDFSRLRSLTVFGVWESYFISENMKILRVLDLENASGVTDKDHEKMLKLLPRLKFLSLRNCQDIKSLPRSVGNLRQLQTLDLRHTSIVTMPASIVKLKKLQYLRVGTTISQKDPSETQTKVFKVFKFRGFLNPVGVEVTSGVGKLTMLHTLGVVSIGSAAGKVILKEIKNLSQLRKLGVFGVNKKNIKEFYSAISAHSHLISLSVWFNVGNCPDGLTSGTIQETAKLPKKLQSLKLYSFPNELPLWINKQLRNLRKINLEILSELDISVIGTLPELNILRLRVKPPSSDDQHKFHLSRPNENEISYEKVKILEVACISGSIEVCIGNLAMQRIEVLKAGCFGESVLQFANLGHLNELKEVHVIGSDDHPLKTHLNERLNGRENVVFLTMGSTWGDNKRNSFPF